LWSALRPGHGWWSLQRSPDPRPDLDFFSGKGKEWEVKSNTKGKRGKGEREKGGKRSWCDFAGRLLSGAEGGWTPLSVATVQP